MSDLAIETVLENYRAMIAKIARVYCDDTELRADLIQEIAIQLWKALPKYKNEFTLSTYVYRIALNTSLSFNRSESRRKKRFVINGNAIESGIVEEQVGESPQLKQLYALIETLKPFDKALVILYLEQKSYQEIADILGVSLSNVGTKLNRIKDNFRKQLTNL